MGIQVDPRLIRQDEQRSHPKLGCKSCGWWDLTMKYGTAKTCTRCGASVHSDADEATKN